MRFRLVKPPVGVVLDPSTASLVPEPKQRTWVLVEPASIGGPVPSLSLRIICPRCNAFASMMAQQQLFDLIMPGQLLQDNAVEFFQIQLERARWLFSEPPKEGKPAKEPIEFELMMGACGQCRLAVWTVWTLRSKQQAQGAVDAIEARRRRH